MVTWGLYFKHGKPDNCDSDTDYLIIDDLGFEAAKWDGEYFVISYGIIEPDNVFWAELPVYHPFYERLKKDVG